MNELMRKKNESFENHIRRVEDLLLRSKDYNEQVRITVVLTKLRIQQQRMNWEQENKAQ